MLPDQARKAATQHQLLTGTGPLRLVDDAPTLPDAAPPACSGLDVMVRLSIVAEDLRGQGWTVNLACEAGPASDRLTLSIHRKA